MAEFVAYDDSDRGWTSGGSNMSVMGDDATLRSKFG